MARPKGTPNRKTNDLADLAKKIGIDPFEVLLLFAAGDWKRLGYKSEMYIASVGEHGQVERYVIDPGVRVKAAGEACQYLYPKRKAIELSTSEDQGFAIVIKDYTGKVAK